MAKTFAGSSIHIGTTAAAKTRAEFEADSFVEIGNVSNMGELGAIANVVQFPTVSDDFVKKSKGTRNAGDPVLVVGRLPNDPGQVAVRAAEATKYFYNFKLVLADAEDELHTDTMIFFRALVAGAPVQFGGNEDFVTESYTLGIYPRPLFVESELITPP